MSYQLSPSPCDIEIIESLLLLLDLIFLWITARIRGAVIILYYAAAYRSKFKNIHQNNNKILYLLSSHILYTHTQYIIV